MKPELDRVKNDVETMQKAMGLSPSMGREWIHWMKRDNWLNLLWCLPGTILIASAFLPSDNTAKYFGLVLAQWTGILVAAAMLGVMITSIRK
jgi:drug/metabolite transporter superfamily protein YnfA